MVDILWRPHSNVSLSLSLSLSLCHCHDHKTIYNDATNLTDQMISRMTRLPSFNAIIMELEDYDAVMTVLAYFIYYHQCQPTDETGSMTSYNRLRTIEDPKAVKRIYGLV